MQNINNSSKVVELTSVSVSMQNTLGDVAKKEKAAQAALLAQIQANLAAAASSVGSIDPSEPAGDSSNPSAMALYNELESDLNALAQNPGDITTLQKIFNDLTQIGGVYDSLSPDMQSLFAKALATPITGPGGETFQQLFLNDLLNAEIANGGATPDGSAAGSPVQTLLAQMQAAFNALPADFLALPMVADLAGTAGSGNGILGLTPAALQAYIAANTTTINGTVYLVMQMDGVKVIIDPTGKQGIPYNLYMMIMMGNTQGFINNSNAADSYQNMINLKMGWIESQPKDEQLMMMMMLLMGLNDNQQAQVGGVSNTANMMQAGSNLVSYLVSTWSAGNFTAQSANQFFQTLSSLKALADANSAPNSPFAQIASKIDADVNFFYNLTATSNGPTFNSLYQQGAAGSAALVAGLNGILPIINGNGAANPVWQQAIQTLNDMSQNINGQSSQTLNTMNQLTTNGNSIEASIKNLNDGYAQWCAQIVKNQIAQG